MSTSMHLFSRWATTRSIQRLPEGGTSRVQRLLDWHITYRTIFRKFHFPLRSFYALTYCLRLTFLTAPRRGLFFGTIGAALKTIGSALIGGAVGALLLSQHPICFRISSVISLQVAPVASLCCARQRLQVWYVTAYFV